MKKSALQMRWIRHAALAVSVTTLGVAAATLPRLPQPVTYHVFADQRSCLGIANCLNVISNLPFALVGLLGLAVILSPAANHPGAFADRWERWPYAALFVGVFLTTAGSSYYHLHPDNATLVWDRLPMSIGFMGLLTALVAERVNTSLARWLFGPLLLLGAASVVYWYWSELRNAGDLRFYLLVQFGTLLLTLLLLVLYPARYRGTGYIIGALAGYTAAKGFELADRAIFSIGQIVSGHTLKHLVAAGAVACLMTMLRHRMRQASVAAP